MVFSSLLFLFRFLPIVLASYYILPKRLRNAALFAASLFFYAWGEPVYVVLMLFSTVTDYLAGMAVSRCRERGLKRLAFAAAACSVAVNLSLLGFFKYSGFFASIIKRLLGIDVPSVDVSLPIGISFYTFQTMSYTIDVYRGDAEPQKDFIAFGAFVSLFPQLIAGPIVRYKTVAEQLKGRRESVDMFCNGIFRFMTGLGKKVLIADQIGMLWGEISGTDSSIASASAWLGIAAFTLEIYFDFSGYSDMAIGLGAMFGFSFPENFNYPYEADSITDFWRRWHISLGTWFRDYVYIPLGGNRKGKGRQLLNIFIVWVLTGLWHGAHWNFVLWGLYYGVILAIEKLFLKPVLLKLPSIVRHVYVMLAVMLGWSLFERQDMADASAFTNAMFLRTGSGFINADTLYWIRSYLVMFIVAIIFSTSIPKKIANRKIFPEGSARTELARMAACAFLFAACVAMLVNSSYSPFLYLRF